MADTNTSQQEKASMPLVVTLERDENSAYKFQTERRKDLDGTKLTTWL